MPLTRVQPGLLEATGTPDNTTFLRGDGAWANPVGTGTVGIAQLSATGTPSSSTFLRGDNTWNTATVAALSTASGSAPSYSARAWVNFNGTGTVAIRASGNVTSITDNGVGDYTLNFTTAMPDANYSFNSNMMMASNTNPVSLNTQLNTAAAGSLRISNQSNNNGSASYGNMDGTFIYVSVFR